MTALPLPEVPPEVLAQVQSLVTSFVPCRKEALEVNGAWQIGYDHTRTARGGAQVQEAEALQLLQEDISRAHQLVTGLLKRDSDGRLQVHPQQLAALVSLALDIGENNFRQSTVLHRTNARRFLEAAAEFLKWSHRGDGKVLRILSRRRMTEANLYCGFPAAR